MIRVLHGRGLDNRVATARTWNRYGMRHVPHPFCDSLPGNPQRGQVGSWRYWHQWGCDRLKSRLAQIKKTLFYKKRDDLEILCYLEDWCYDVSLHPLSDVKVLALLLNALSTTVNNTLKH